MPFRRRRRRRLRFRRRRKTGRGSTRAIALRALARTDGEMNYVGIAGDLGPIAHPQDSGALLLNGIARGSSRSDRLGIEALITQIEMTLQFQRNDGADRDQTDFVRWMIVKDRQPNGALPLIADILEFPPASTDEVMLLASYANLNQKKRYRIVHEGILLFDFAHQVKQVNRRFKFKLKTEYTGDNATITNLTSNGLFLFVMADKNANEMGVALHLQFRIHFRP